MGAFAQDRSQKALGVWLFSIAVMVLIMVVLGGLTRLTGSGLSMVDWRPVTGWLPPLDESQWQGVFDLYKNSPEYMKINYGMSLDEFKGIFWLEFFHRLWGRFIGLAFAIPFVIFFFKGWISRKMILPLISLFLLGGLQGFIGWYMVQSGLVHDPAVSQYRLTLHLGMAFLLIGLLIWYGLSFISQGRSFQPVSIYTRTGSLFILFWAFLTVCAGALVAGLDAGLTYNTFPLMDGEWVPGGLFSIAPWYLNLFENITTVQFQHRVLAELLCVFVLLFFFLNWKALSPKAQRVMNLCVFLVLLQAGLGIMTLLKAVPLALASLHQTGGLLLFSSIIWLVFELHRAKGASLSQRSAFS